MLTQASDENHEKARLLNLLASYGIREPILSAFDEVPREVFVNREFRYAAYEDHPLPIGSGQTISQPSLVALMLQSLNLSGGEKVLEIGTGSGFQAALLGKLAREVWTIERIPSLARKAKRTIKKLKLENVHVIEGDGTEGYKRHAPYDAIIVTAAGKVVPKSLVQQLVEGGKLIMPVGEEEWQEVILYKREEGKLKEISRVTPARFVPLIGKHAAKE